MMRDEVLALDQRHVWHPYTSYGDQARAVQLVVHRAEGARLYDVDGRSYLDGNSSWWVTLLGHRHPRLVAALERQARDLCHVSFGDISHEPAACLAAELVAVAPKGLSRVFYSDNGSTAVEAALKMCLKYWQQNGQPRRQRVVGLDHAFHGETLGVTALSGVEVFRRPFAGVLMDCVHVATDEAGFERAFELLEDELRRGADEIAACFVEPLIQGAGGMRFYSERFLARMRALTEELDVFLVVDEVFTGYGRTGSMWASDLAGIAPDILCTAKGFTGGILPMAATLVTDRIFKGFAGEPSRAFHYGHTYAGHPLGAAIAREVLAIYREERVIEGVAERAKKIQTAFSALSECPGVSGVRSLGMVAALNLELGDASGYLAQGGWKVYERALQLGAVLRPLGDVVYVAPALNIPHGDLDELLAIVTQAVREVSGATPGRRVGPNH